MTPCRGPATDALFTIPVIIVSRHHWVPLYWENWDVLVTWLPVNMMVYIGQVFLAFLVPFSRILWLRGPCLEILTHILLGQTSYRFWEWRLQNLVQKKEGTGQPPEFRQTEHPPWANRHEAAWVGKYQAGTDPCRMDISLPLPILSSRYRDAHVFADLAVSELSSGRMSWVCVGQISSIRKLGWAGVL